MKTELLALLQEENFVSGQKISETLHVSRTAVWKIISHLRDEGYEIQAGFHPALDYLKAVDQLIQHSTQTNSKGGKI